ncbi:hypothetical protein Tco_0524851 [Tanacetum coccineum]
MKCVVRTTVSIVETENITEAMADPAWIEATCSEELIQLDKTTQVDKTTFRTDRNQAKWKRLLISKNHMLQLLAWELSMIYVAYAATQVAVQRSMTYCNCHPQRLNTWRNVASFVAQSAIAITSTPCQQLPVPSTSILDHIPQRTVENALPEAKVSYPRQTELMRCMTPAELAVLTNNLS